MARTAFLPATAFVISMISLAGVGFLAIKPEEKQAAPIKLDLRFQQLGIHNMCINMDGAEVTSMTKKQGDGTCPHDFNWHQKDKAGENISTGSII